VLAVKSGELCTAVILMFVSEAAKVSTALHSGKINRIIAAKKNLLEGCNFFLAQSGSFFDS
jgi:hypothetical protein